MVSGPANHGEDHRTRYQHDLHQRWPLLDNHISHLSYPCRKKWPKGRFSSGPFSSTKCGKAIAARAPVPLSSPLHAHEFRDCARHGRASALPERPAFVGFQCFV